MNRYIIKKYLSYLNLKQYSEHRSEINFRCPLPNCGDLQSKKSNPRGYVIHLDSTHPRYHCHNCSTDITFYNFIRLIDQRVFQQLKQELKNYKFEDFAKGTKKKDVEVVEVKTTKKKKKRRKIRKLSDYLYSISEMKRTHRVVKYLKDRRIPKAHWDNLFYFNDNPYDFYDKFFVTDKYENRIARAFEGVLIPFYNRDDKLYGFTLRNIHPEHIDPRRYIKLNYKDDPLDDDFIGVNKVNFNKKVYIVEGILDKLSIRRDNQVLAMTSLNTKLTKIPKNINKKNIVYLFDNEYYNLDLIDSALKVINAGYGVMLWDKKMRAKDINALKKENHKNGNPWRDDDFFNYFDNRTFYGLEAEMELDKLSDISIERMQYIINK
jgi:hypothetical protein